MALLYLLNSMLPPSIMNCHCPSCAFSFTFTTPFIPMHALYVQSISCKMLPTYLRCAFSHSYGCIKCAQHSLWLFRKHACICISVRQSGHTMVLTFCFVAVSRTCPDCFPIAYEAVFSSNAALWTQLWHSVYICGVQRGAEQAREQGPQKLRRQASWRQADHR